MFKLIAEVLGETTNREHGGISQGANRAARHIVPDRFQQLQIAVTAFAMKGDEQKIREGGCEAYISKPISVVSFLQTIDSYLKKPQ